MLPKTQRLSTFEFTQHYQTASVRRHATHVSVLYSPAPALKVAMVVGKKVAKTAVLRNELRRQGYGVVAEMHKNNQLALGTYIIIAKPSYRGLCKNERRQALSSLLAEIAKTR
jgi:ribonuclease P protein component